MFASRGEDCFKSQLGILLTAVFVLSSRRASSEELSQAVCFLFWRCVPPSSEACCSVEMKSEQASFVYIVGHRWKEPKQWIIPLTQLLLGDLFILPVSCYKFKASSHRKESFLCAASIRFSCYLWEKRVSVQCSRRLPPTWETSPPWGRWGPSSLACWGFTVPPLDSPDRGGVCRPACSTGIVVSAMHQRCLPWLYPWLRQHWWVLSVNAIFF